MVLLNTNSLGGADIHGSSSDNGQGRISLVPTSRDLPLVLPPGQPNDRREPTVSLLADNEIIDTYVQMDNAWKQLPANANRDAQPSINFFGSSYSGADIKVVAHLYDIVELNEEEKERMNQEKAVADLVVDGCESLLGGGLAGLAQQQENGNPLFFADSGPRRELFISATGLSPIDPPSQRAIQILTYNVLKTTNYSFIEVARMRNDVLRIQTSFQARANELETKISDLSELAKKSSSTLTLGTLQTLSIQSHREKFGVRALGHSYAKGYTRGPRTLAGTMIFTLFNEHSLANLIRALGNSNTYGERDRELTSLLPDQLPPLDLTVVFANEYGSLSDFRLYGVEFVNDGTTYSIEDLLSENVMQFVCRDADVMTSRGNIRLSRLQRGMFNESNDKDVSGSSLLFDNAAYDEYLEKLKVRRRLFNR